MLKFLYRSCIITILSCALITQSFAQSAPPPAAVPQSNSNNVMTQQAQQALLATQMYAMAAADKKAKDACAQSSSSQECMSATVAAARAHAETRAMQDRIAANSGSGSPSGTTTTNEGVVIDNKTGVQTVTKTAEGLGGKEFKPDMLNSVTMAIIGMLAIKLVGYQPMTTDQMFAAGAGASFIVGELSSSDDVNSFTKDLTYRSDGKVDNEQMAALEKMKTDLEKARDGVKKKKNFQQIAMYAFAAATIIAGYQAFMLSTYLTACTAGVAAGSAAVLTTALCAAGVGGVANVALLVGVVTPSPCASDKVLWTTSTATLTATTTACPPAVTQCSAFVAYSQIVVPGGIPLMLTGQNDFLRPPLLYTPMAAMAPQVVAETKMSPNFLERVFNLFISKAEAGKMELLFGVGGVAAAFLLSKTLGVTIDMLMSTPFKRMLVWGVLGVLSKKAVDSSQKIIDELEGQIAKVNAIIASMKGAGQGVVGQQMAVAQNAVMPTFGVSGGGFEPIGDGGNIPCATSAGSTDCPSMAKALTNAPEWKALPADVQGLAMGLGKYMDKVQGKPGISADAMGAGAALSGAGNGLNKMLGNARANVNSQLRKMGQPTIDFNKRENDLLKQMNQATADGLQKSGMSAGGFLASMGRGGGGDAAVKKPEAPTFAKSKGTPAVGGGAAATPKAPTFNFKDDKPALEAGAEGAGGKNDVYEMNGKNDISADASGSIFTLISERYFKSAYPKLLEETPAPAATPATVKK